MSRAVLATSLNPAADAVQDAAVASWRAQGFAVVSFNVAAEAERLAPRYPGAVFREPARVAAGKPLPLIGEMIADIAREDADLFGIVNADIVFHADAAIPRRVAPPRRTLIAVTRTDIDSLSEWRNPAPARGFDAFFFDPALAEILDDRPFCIGMPDWGYWLPLAAFAAGWNLAAITAPIALHVRHETRWSDRTLAFNHHLMRFLFSPRVRATAAWLPPDADETYRDLAFRVFSDSSLADDERAAALEDLARFQDETMSATLAALRTRMPEYPPVG